MPQEGCVSCLWHFLGIFYDKKHQFLARCVNIQARLDSGPSLIYRPKVDFPRTNQVNCTVYHAKILFVFPGCLRHSIAIKALNVKSCLAFNVFDQIKTVYKYSFVIRVYTPPSTNAFSRHLRTTKALIRLRMRSLIRAFAVRLQNIGYCRILRRKKYCNGTVNLRRMI